MTTETPRRHTPRDAPNSIAAGPQHPERHDYPDSQRIRALGSNTSGQGQSAPDSQRSTALVGSSSAAAANAVPLSDHAPRPSLFDPTLFMLASLLDDIEGIRKANGNRTRILTATEPDEDGVMRGFGLDAAHPTVATLQALGTQLDALEHGAILALNRAMRAHPLAPFQKRAKGVGEKQLARLLAAVGDPYLRTMPDGTTQPRTVSQLWAYCGLHTLPSGPMPANAQGPRAAGGQTHPAGTIVPARHIQGSSLPGDHVAAKRQKGVKANWSTDAKTRAYLIATSCIKTSGEYRQVYDARRALTGQTHPDWTPGHSHNDALRIVSKRVLRDLWRAARDYHQPQLMEEAA